MVNVQALIWLYKGEAVRQTPFASGYSPLFSFSKQTPTAGQITLTNQAVFSPGEEGMVQIAFSERQHLGTDFGVGTRFHFSEGAEPVGDGVIVSIL